MGAFIATQVCGCAACLACTCCAGVVSFTLSQAARFGHMLVLFSLFLFAAILGLFSPSYFYDNSQYTGLNIDKDCNDAFLDNCIYRQLIYRASFVLFVTFIVLASFAYCSDLVNKSFWIIKFGVTTLAFFGFWWGDNAFFSGWAEVARVISFFWLLAQSVLFIDFSHDVHDILTKKMDNSENYFPTIFYLLFSAVGLICAAVGLGYLFTDYTGCDTGMAFVVVTLIMGALSTVISLLNVVNKGLLTPCLLFAYSVFMCWYALLNNPKESCNPTYDSVHGENNSALAIVVSLSFLVILYCVINGTRIIEAFDPLGEGVLNSFSRDNQRALETQLTGAHADENVLTSQPNGSKPSGSMRSGSYDPNAELDFFDQSSGTPTERVAFHGFMVLASCYGAMILTGWGKTNGSPPGGDGDNATSIESQYLIIVAQWFFIIFYFKILHAAYITGGE